MGVLELTIVVLCVMLIVMAIIDIIKWRLKPPKAKRQKMDDSQRLRHQLYGDSSKRP